MRRIFHKILSVLLASFLLAGCSLYKPVDLSAAVQSGIEHTNVFSNHLNDTIGSISFPLQQHSSDESPRKETIEDGRTLPSMEVFPTLDGIHADLSFSEMNWEIYDASDFFYWCDRLTECRDAGQGKEIFDWLTREYIRLATYYNQANVDYYLSPSSEELYDACTTLDSLSTECFESLNSAVSSAIHNMGRKFQSLIGEEMTWYFSGYEGASERETELNERETVLEFDYEMLMARSDMSERERNRQAGEIFLELVSIRNELAQLYGYDSYADYAYSAFYARDYSPEDAALLCERIRPLSCRFYDTCYYCDIFYTDTGYSAPDAGEILQILNEWAPEISFRAAEAEKYLETHDLLISGKAGEVSDMGFNETWEYYQAPIIYYAMNDSMDDLQGVIHEFGHYYDAFINPLPNYFTSVGAMDIYEIHSTGMEMMFYNFYDQIFGEYADEARIYCMDGMLSNISSGCMMDEFQQYVYSHPGMTVSEVNQAYARIAESYGDTISTTADSYYWMYVSHTFSHPFYYISYAASALAALQLWDISITDPVHALELYNEIVDYGAFDYCYGEILSMAGLRALEDSADVFSSALGYQEKLCTVWEQNAA